MNLHKLPSKKQSKSSQTDEFEQAALAEYQKGYVRLNLMADALKHAAGDQTQARVLYLQQVAVKIKQEQKIKAQLQQQAPSTRKPSVSLLERCADWIADYWYILPSSLLVGFVLLNNPKQLAQQATELLGFGRDLSATATTTSSSVGAEHTYQPPIGFGLQQDGQPLEVAQQAAALSALGSANPASDRQVLSYVPRDGKVRIPTEQPTAATSACQHHPVMSNQDYLNCGLKPPNSTSNNAAKAFDPML